MTLLPVKKVGYHAIQGLAVEQKP